VQQPLKLVNLVNLLEASLKGFRLAGSMLPAGMVLYLPLPLPLPVPLPLPLPLPLPPASASRLCGKLSNVAESSLFRRDFLKPF
jgi:hypothetical protein